MNRLFSFIYTSFISITLWGQTQYDYYDDKDVSGSVDLALNGILFLILVIIGALLLIVFFSFLFKAYYMLNPKANPEYRKEFEKEEAEKKRIKEEKEMRKNAIPEAVDLGLSVMWGAFNLGAYKPNDIGEKYYWAENTPSVITQPRYKNVNPNVIGEIQGNKRFDPATNLLGDNWRTPPAHECEELIEMCLWEIENLEGVEGYKITGPNGHSIFLPVNEVFSAIRIEKNGCYWTSTPSFQRLQTNGARYLSFSTGPISPASIRIGTADGCLFCIRPIYSYTNTFVNEPGRKSNTFSSIPQFKLTKDELDCLYQDFERLSTIREDEKKEGVVVLGGLRSFAFKENMIKEDEFNVVYSSDGKRLLDGLYCNCKSYEIKEGTEIVCKYAFGKEYEKGICGEIILPHTLLFIDGSSLPDRCNIISNNSNYSVINQLLIDNRKNSVVRCLDKYIQEVFIGEPIEEIGERAFSGCIALRKVFLPKTLRKVGKEAFASCEMLEYVNLPESLFEIADGAFYYCKKLIFNSLPTKLKRLGNFPFVCCKMVDATIPETLQEIGCSPFPESIRNLKSVSNRYIIEDSLLIDIQKNEVIQSIGNSIADVVLPRNIVRIRRNAFSGSDIQSIVLSRNIYEIGAYAFSRCKKLATIHFDCLLRNIPIGLFANCESLIYFKTPTSVEVIESSAFYGCINLKKVELNKGIKKIDKRVFEDCAKLESINIPETVEQIGDNFVPSFKGCNNLKVIFYNACRAEIVGLPNKVSSITIGIHVQIIPSNFINNNSIISSIIIPQNVVRLSKWSIANCPNLKELIILSQDVIMEEKWIVNCNNVRVIRLKKEYIERLRPSLPTNAVIKPIKSHKLFKFKW